MQVTRMWQGYLIQSNGDNHFINSPWKLGNECVFGYDSDYTTMAISIIRFLSGAFSLSLLLSTILSFALNAVLAIIIKKVQWV